MKYLLSLFILHAVDVNGTQSAHIYLERVVTYREQLYGISRPI